MAHCHGTHIPPQLKNLRGASNEWNTEWMGGTHRNQKANKYAHCSRSHQRFVDHSRFVSLVFFVSYNFSSTRGESEEKYEMLESHIGITYGHMCCLTYRFIRIHSSAVLSWPWLITHIYIYSYMLQHIMLYIWYISEVITITLNSH